VELKTQGCAFLYVSHRMDEVFEVADRICVLRNGRWIEERPVAQWSLDDLGSTVVGKRLGDIFPPREEMKQPLPNSVLKTTQWCVPESSRPSGFAVENFCLEVKPGEIVGLFGLLGSGRTEILESLFGLRPGFDRDTDSGYTPPASASAAWKSGMAFLPEDRRGLGLLLERPLRENMALAAWPRTGPAWSWVDAIWEEKLAQEQMEALAVKAPHQEFAVGRLSGGNQQKVLLGKCLALNPRILLLDDPTRGVDVGAKAEIYRIIRRCAQKGMAILIASSENEEIIGLCDRFHILRQGKASPSYSPSEWTLEKAFTYAAQGGDAPHQPPSTT
jgi:ribose transport system ATP-binding protein